MPTSGATVRHGTRRLATAVYALRGPARYGPFLLLLSIGLALPAFALTAGAQPAQSAWWAGAGALVVGMLALWWLADRHQALGWLSFPSALLSFAVIVLLELADPQHATAYIPLLILPVLWSALYEEGPRLAATLLLAALTLGIPMLLVGAPGYPVSTWRLALLWLFALTLLGTTVSALVAVTGRVAAGQDINVGSESEQTLPGDLVATVSHDVRAPLTTIGAYVQLLESGDAGELTDDQRAMMDVIEENLRRTYAITDDLLALRRIERAPLEKPNTEICIGDVVEQAVRFIEPSSHARGQQVRMDLQLGTARVAGHEGQLDRAISNLLTNAVKFTPEGGTITVRGRVDRADGAGRVDGADGVSGASVVITVSDNGVGIAPEEQEKIFQRFYRSDSIGPQRVSGTGLGLAIVSEIAALHGGSIAVTSTPGNGATFTLTLPALAIAAGPTVSAAEAAPEPRRAGYPG